MSVFMRKKDREVCKFDTKAMEEKSVVILRMITDASC